MPNFTNLLRQTFEREPCLYVKDSTTGLVAHVYGHSTGTPPNPTADNIAEVLAYAARSLTIDVNGPEDPTLDQILALVTQVRGGHEFTGDWVKPDEV